MKCRHHLSILLTVALVITAGCAMWDFDLDFHNVRAMYAELGICNQSVSDYNKIIKKDAIDYGAYLCRGKAYYEQGQYEQAISDYTMAIEIFPESDSAYYGRGNAYCLKGLYDMAISDFTDAIERNPKRAGAYYQRGKIYYLKKGFVAWPFPITPRP